MIKSILLLGFSLFSLIISAQSWNEVQGQGSGVNISTGDRNTFYGDSSGYQTNHGLDNTFIGFNAGREMTTGDYNIAYRVACLKKCSISTK